MCGIVGYAGYRNATEPILRSLKRLEYRGYDSAGVAIAKGKKLSLCKTKGSINDLEEILPKLEGCVGIGHTRWATHGRPSTENAHPLCSCKSDVAVVHNGIIENYRDLKEQLIKEGHEFVSETDTEVIVHLIEKHNQDDFYDAVKEAISELTGSFAIAAVRKGSDKIVVARKDSPLIIGLGKNENFIASDIPAVLEYTDRVVYLHDKEMAVVDSKGYKITTFDGEDVERESVTVTLALEDAEKGGYEHFMLKEIFEQPGAIHKTMLGRLLDIEMNGLDLHGFTSIKIVACGTSYHAGLVGKYIMEELVKMPTSVDMASEYRYSSPAFERPFVILITQSGETADTLAAAREARHRGCRTIAITNVAGSTITREVDQVFYTRAGIEIGVAATKTFTTQIAVLYLLGLKLGLMRKTISHTKSEEIKNNLRTLPRHVRNVLDMSEDIREKAKMFKGVGNAFFIGRNINYPIALEGALKMKEISYLHAEGYPAGELKHGPLALLTKETPTIAIAVDDHTYEKMLGNIGEVNARDSPVLAIGVESDKSLVKYADEVILVPDTDGLFSPILVVVALQLLAYYVAKERGCEIDKPRNLAKSVTVE